MNRWQIILAARALVGTPFHHAGRLAGPGGGLDCPGVVVLTAGAVRYPVHDDEPYSLLPRPGQLLPRMRRDFEEIEVGEMRPGDIPIMWFDRGTMEPQHMGVLTDLGMVHGWMNVGHIVENTEISRWMRRTTHAFRFRGVDPWPH